MFVQSAHRNGQIEHKLTKYVFLLCKDRNRK